MSVNKLVELVTDQYTEIGFPIGTKMLLYSNVDGITQLKSLTDDQFLVVYESNFKVVEDNKDVGTKNDSDKPDLSLIPTDALFGIAAALSYGAKKYDRHNFRKGIAYSRLVAACMRHLSVFNEGEELDSESGLSHLDHAMATLAMLKFMTVNKSDMDDRFIKPVDENTVYKKILDGLE